MSSPASKSKCPEPGSGLPPDPVFAAALLATVDSRPAVLAAVVGIQGSSPREVGARMLITADSIAGSVGGGVLEHMVIQRARTLLRDSDPGHCLLSFPLGPDSQQCCGGVVTLFLEPLAGTDRHWLEHLSADALSPGVGIATSLGKPSNKTLIDPAAPPETLPQDAAEWFGQRAVSDASLFVDGEREFLCQYLAQPGFQVALFGAGHVGRAIAAALAFHHCTVLWVDPRAQEFPDPLPASARALVTDDVEAAMQQVRPGSMVLVMTHRHPLDYDICRAVLERGDCPFLGLIGSVTKRRRFAKALVRNGIDERAVARLCCPIGIPQLKGKEPAVIAASAVAQLLSLAEDERQLSQGTNIGIRERDAEQSCVAASF